MRVLFFLGLLCALGAAGDLVHLKNGRLLKGRVVQETKTAVVVDVGAGRVTVARSHTLSIRHDQRATGSG